MIFPLPSVFHCTLLDREADRDDCHECRLGAVCAGIPSRLMRRSAKPAGPERNVLPCVPAVAESEDRAVVCLNSTPARGTSDQRARSGSGLGEKFGFGDTPRSLLTASKQPAPIPRLEREGVRDDG